MSKQKQALISFQMDGQEYGFVMPADSWDDAERRMRAIRTTGMVAGWPCYTYRANSLTLPFVAAWTIASTFFRNLFRASQ
jgi:hypothetical protein